jgi:hypothetical protein
VLNRPPPDGTRAHALEQQFALTAHGAIGSTSRHHIQGWPTQRAKRVIACWVLPDHVERDVQAYSSTPGPQIGADSVTSLDDLKYTLGSLVSVADGWTIRNRAPAAGPYS